MNLSINIMKTATQIQTTKLLMAFSFIMLFVFSCGKEDEGFPITSDLRVLQKKIGNKVVEDGVADLSVLSEIQLVYSNALDPTTFESALSVTPQVPYSISYDESGSIVTITPTTRFAYATGYKMELPMGTYGAMGEKSIENFTFNFTTKAFAPPKIMLSSDANTFFEGEVITVTASLDNIIFDDVTFDLVFGGTAEGGGIDYTASATSISIPAGSSNATFTVTSIAGDAVEGTESISITLNNVVNGSNDPAQELILSLGDKAPALELKGVMELDDYIDGVNGQVRAIHLTVLKDIADLSIYHIQIASNGAAPDPLDRDFIFPAQSASAGDELIVVRDIDAPAAAIYFGSNYSQFTEFKTAGMTHNGDDAILLYENGVSIESFGQPGIDGTGLFWEYTNSWAYKFSEEWYYAGVNCPVNAVGEATDATSRCRYPLFSPGLEFKGIMHITGTPGPIRAYHMIALGDIPDMSIFGAGIASNGQATSDGVEIPFPNVAVKAGEHILVIRESDLPNAVTYFGSCYNKFDHVLSIAGTSVSSNGDDTIELFKNNILIETYGELGVDATPVGGPNAIWDYTGSWAFKVSGAWTYGGAGCTVGAATNAASSCVYTFCK